MPAVIEVSDEDISYAERILLPAGEFFDEERRCFIKNMSTLDLQAVPGSGKTTALLAKLLILDRYLPFEDGSGILVISHTNAAIDEIKGKIGNHCAHLFRYPNFVGTIQAFVDDFLAIPFYTNKFGVVPVRIDDGFYNQKFSDPPFGLRGFSTQESKDARRYLRANKKNIRWTFVNGKALLTDGYGGGEIDFKKPRGNTKPQNYEDWSDEEKSRIRKWINTFKSSILKSGCLCYDDAYFLAYFSISQNNAVIDLLQRRFGYVFVDEMQDMERHQYDLLEKLFHGAADNAVIYQRIGDKNQSIFDGRNSSDNSFWMDRSTVLELNGSYRLSRMVAEVVTAFSVSPIKIEGRRKNADGSDIAIKPTFIVYSDSTKEQVIPKFASIVRRMIDEGLIPDDSRNCYKAVAWATKSENGKVRLPSYYPPYVKVDIRTRVERSSLADHFLAIDRGSYLLGSIEQAVVNALLQILRIEEIYDGMGRYFTKRSMHKFLQDYALDYWGDYRSSIYLWCLDIARGKISDALMKIREHLPKFLSMFDCQINKSWDFVRGAASDYECADLTKEKDVSNVLVSGGVKVDIATVHRVKGETHTATLYMESFYERGGGGNYESERLSEQFKKRPIGKDAHNLVRQSAKMIYVGFSRPTHLLCFAVHESRFAPMGVDVNTDIWDVVRLPQ